MNSQILTIHMIYSCVLNEIKYFGVKCFLFCDCWVLLRFAEQEMETFCLTSLRLAPGVLRGPRVVVTKVHFFHYQTDCFSLLFPFYRPCIPTSPRAPSSPFLIIKLLWGFVSFCEEEKGGKREGRQPLSPLFSDCP